MSYIKKTSIFAVIAILISVSFTSLAMAQCTELAERYKKETRQAEINMLEAKQTLLDKDPGEWMPFEVQAFEYYSLWVVYAATMSYIADNGFKSLPSDMSELESLGYIIYWPENPYREWSKVEVLDFSDEFSAGDVAIGIAPVTHRDGNSPCAFEMIVYGPDPDFSLYGSVEPLSLNEEWVVVPTGALYMLGFS